ncbi:MAG: hypothetical protein M3463_07705 [Verrucomicrobiota bacterium]|nr:hypothetical protein [Verrucomicrobiota bacterium]
MNAESQPNRRTRRRTTFTAGQARERILTKLRAAGAKGAPALFSARTPESRRAVLEETLAALESERAIAVDRGKARARYYLPEFAPARPTLESVCARLEQIAAVKHPHLLSASELKRGLLKTEQPLFEKACYWLETQRQLVKLLRGKTALFACAGSLRFFLGEAASEDGIHPERIREAYRTLAARTGFPAVEIAALQRATGAPLDALRPWLLDEYRQGRAVFSSGDWSLAEEATRAAALQVGDARYLLVRLQE